MNYYEILGLREGATDQQIKEAYRREAMKWHPDRHEGLEAKAEATRRFKDIAEAYRKLRDPAERAAYDQERSQRTQSQYDGAQSDGADSEHNDQRSSRHRRETKTERPESTNHSGTNYQGEGVSGQEANNIFFEQMIDLAFEMAGRGFSPENIHKALLALGCPDSMARSVSIIASKRTASGDFKSESTTKNGRQAVKNLEESRWEDVASYYRAAVMGAHDSGMLSDDQFKGIKNTISGRLKFWFGLACAVVVGGIILADKGIVDKANGLLIVVGIFTLILLAAIISRNFFLGPNKRQFFAESAGRYYLEAFKSFHNGSVPPVVPTGFNLYAGFFNALWLGYRRNLMAALILVTVFATINILFSIASVSDNKPLLIFVIIAGYLIPTLWGNRLYFWLIKRRIKFAAAGATEEQAISKLRKSGGVNQFGWILPLVLSAILSAPVIAIEEERESERRRVATEEITRKEQQEAALQAQRAAEQAAQIKAQQEAAEQQAQLALQQAYMRRLQQIEASFPQLNPDSPRYLPEHSDWVVQRLNFYKSQGRDNLESLNLAMADYVAAIQSQF